MKRPSFQFYPGDWQSNSNLRRCTHAEKGAWLDVMCLMHDQPEYGILRWPLKDIAQAIGAPLPLVRALVSKGVMKGDDTSLTEANIYVPRSGRKDGEPVTLVAPQAGPVWYSSRMVKDEHVRTIRGDGTRFGDPDGADPGEARKASPKPPIGDGPSSSSSSSSSENTPQAPKGAEPPGFARFWAVWPAHFRRAGKDQCLRKWEAKGCEAMTDHVVAAVQRAKQSPEWLKESGQFIPAPLTWLNQARWEAANSAPAADDTPWANAR